jgi:hypothetical protein
MDFDVDKVMNVVTRLLPDEGIDAVMIGGHAVNHSRSFGMIRFPTVSNKAGMKVLRMGMRDNVRFSEHCLRSNPAITPENCMVKRAAEKTIKTPFRLKRGP